MMKLDTTLAASFSLLVLFASGSASAQASWNSWISEENGGPWSICGPSNEAVSGLRCNGSYCDNVSIRCETMPYGITVQGYNTSDSFSEEDNGIGTTSSEGWYRYDNSFSHVCNWAGAAGIVTGIRCQGSNCDNITLECATPVTNVGGVVEPVDLTDCSWSGYYSEEDPWFAYGVGANRFIAGIRCQGSYCDNKSYYVCSMQPAANSCMGSCGGQAQSGCWCDNLCQQFGDCCQDFGPACS